MSGGRVAFMLRQRARLLSALDVTEPRWPAPDIKSSFRKKIRGDSSAAMSISRTRGSPSSSRDDENRMTIPSSKPSTTNRNTRDPSRDYR